jgi:hypothetical protein
MMLVTNRWLLMANADIICVLDSFKTAEIDKFIVGWYSTKYRAN